MSFAVELLESSVEIGETENDNTIKIRVKNNDANADSWTRVTVAVPCGSGAADLLASVDDPVTVQYTLPGDREPSEDLDPDRSAPAGKRAWSVEEHLAPDSEMVIALTGFTSDTPPGTAIVTVTPAREADQFKGTPHELEVGKSASPSTAPLLRYFRVVPDYVLHAGATKVTVSFLATGYQSATLFRNNQEVDTWPATEDGIDVSYYQDRPSITTLYRLRLVREPEVGEAEPQADVHWRTVQVVSPGWNRLTLPQGSPTGLVVAADVRGGDAERLYGIFYDPVQKKARLYSSETGVDAWDLESDSVPEGMESSPAVAFGGKLWLVGGSAVDPWKPSSKMHCFGKDANRDDKVGWHQPPKTGAGGHLELPQSLFGHCCVVVGEGLWVLGGWNNGVVFDDLWRLPKDGEKFTTEAQEQSWDARCLHSVVATRGGERPTVWLYGGRSDPSHAKGYNDLWSTEDGRSWKLHTKAEALTAIVPDPGQPLGCTLVARQESPDAAGERLMLLGSFKEWASPDHALRITKDTKVSVGMIGNRISSWLLDHHSDTGTWEASPVSGGWKQFKGNPFSMRAVAFNGFLFVYTLSRNLARHLNLNIRIP